MAVRLIYNHIAHHARCSGYDQLAKYVNGEAYVQEGLPNKLAESISWKRIRNMPYYRSAWYGGPALRREIEICVRMLVPQRTIYHFLYAENDLRCTSLWRLRWNNKIVGSFHQPPEFLDAHVEDKRYIKGASAAVVMSQSQVSFLEQFLPAKRIYHVPHGVDTKYWCPDPAVPRWEHPTFLVVGQWLRDIEMIVATARAMETAEPSARFHVVTFKEHAAQFEGLSNTKVMSGIPDARLLEENRRCLALFLPLKLATSNNAVLEAMACGTTVVSTRSGGTPEYVDDTGILVEPGDVDGAIAALRSLIADRDLAERLGRKARERTQTHYSWEVVGEQMNVAYRDIL
ncbi:MAG: glycosyltransferase [Planctomycetota bacterium]